MPEDAPVSLPKPDEVEANEEEEAEEVIEGLNGSDGDHMSPTSPVKSPLKEEQPIIDGNNGHHVADEEPDAEALPTETPAEAPLNPLEDWGHPQAMPAPIG